MKKSSLIILCIILIVILAGGTALFFVLSSKTGDSGNNLPGVNSPKVISENEYSAMCISVTFGDDVNTTKNFCWQTFAKYSSGALQYFPITEDTAGIDFDSAGSSKIITVSSTSEETGIMLPEENSSLKSPSLTEHSGLIHRVWLTDLTPGTKYMYRIGDTSENKWSSSAIFTVPLADSETSFLYITDAQGYTQSDYDIWGNLITAAAEKFPGAEFIMNLGDTVEENTNQNQWRMFFETPYDILRSSTFVSAAGNKDKKSTMQHFTFGASDDRTSRVSGYYSFDYESIHFSVIYTGDNDKDLSDSQLKWLEQDLASSDAVWKIVLMHKSPVTNANHCNDVEITALREQLLPVFDEYGVDVVIAGHDHYFFRSKPMTANGVSNYITDIKTSDGDPVVMYSRISDGTFYFMNGSAGVKQHDGKLYEIDGVYPEDAYTTELPSYSYCTANENEIIFKTYTVSENGESQLIDAWGLIREESETMQENAETLESIFVNCYKPEVCAASFAKDLKSVGAGKIAEYTITEEDEYVIIVVLTDEYNNKYAATLDAKTGFVGVIYENELGGKALYYMTDD
ncbi:MAG: metallophosphoesterase family protein [Clostridia bacterium]|nr:metallophosphoesterase family protein [Clostridia bacterium]